MRHQLVEINGTRQNCPHNPIGVKSNIWDDSKNKDECSWSLLPVALTFEGEQLTCKQNGSNLILQNPRKSTYWICLVWAVGINKAVKLSRKQASRCYITETRTMMAAACFQYHRSTGIERATADQATSNEPDNYINWYNYQLIWEIKNH